MRMDLDPPVLSVARPLTLEEICSLEQDPGYCFSRQRSTRWFFDRRARRCSEFQFTGCGGNQNNFEDEQTCWMYCDRQRARHYQQQQKQQQQEQRRREHPTRHHHHQRGPDGDRRRPPAQVVPTNPPSSSEENKVIDVVYQPGLGVDRQITADRPRFVNQGNSDARLPQQAGDADGGVDGVVQVHSDVEQTGGEEDDDNLLPDLEDDSGEYYDVDPSELIDEAGAEIPDVPRVEKLGGGTKQRPPPPSQRKYAAPTSILPDLCRRPLDPGPCYGNELRWYYNLDEQQCATFEWSGCGGNSNLFTSEESCKRACGAYRDQDICKMPEDPGPCVASIVKWRFHPVDQVCSNFIYGGCEGNGNRFSSRAECENLCQSEAQLLKGADICSLPSVTGPCRAAERRWFFSLERAKCEEFTYGGCQGNDNNFPSQRDCEARCVRPVAKESGDCLLDKDPGPCLDPTSMWFFDRAVSECRLFTYGGCRGNGNRFENKRECEQICQGKRVGEVLSDEDREAVCTLPFERGPCTAEQVRYYYDVRAKTCFSFVYSGCLGNPNRFLTHSECLDSCRGVAISSGEGGLDGAGADKEGVHVVIETGSGSVRAGLNLYLHCRKADRSEVAPAVWFRDDAQVLSNRDGRIKIFDNGTLLINDFKATDIGEYACAAAAQGGEISEGVKLSISDLPESSVVAAPPHQRTPESPPTAPLATEQSSSPGAEGSDGAPEQEAGCRDDPVFQDCPMVRRAKLCAHPYYSRFCCATCQTQS